MPNSLHIPQRFVRAVALHQIKNFLWQQTDPPLFLGIPGPPGYGKTFQLGWALKQMGVKVFLISGGQLESPEAGAPAQLLRNTYRNAGLAIDKRECLASAIVMNDVDTGLGDFGELVQYTVNRQTVSGELMHLADFPTEVEGRQTRRIPIFLTGNDLSKLYSPLIRTGRMNIFHWRPTADEMIQILHFNIFPELSHFECQKLVNEFIDQPTVFFSQMRSRLADENLWQQIEKVGAETMFSKLQQGLPRISYEAVNYHNLLRIGRLIMDEIKSNVNFLESNVIRNSQNTLARKA